MPHPHAQGPQGVHNVAGLAPHLQVRRLRRHGQRHPALGSHPPAAAQQAARPQGNPASTQNQVHDLKFSPTGSLLVSASSDESLKFWDVSFDTKAKEVTLIKAHNARIRAVGFSCDGLLLSSCGDDKLVKIWSTVDRRLQYTLKQHNNWVRYC